MGHVVALSHPTLIINTPPQSNAQPVQTLEHERLHSSEESVPPWRQWGTYVSDRSWGTVREDYSGNGDAWNFLPHDHARSKAYRWGEDAIAGWCDRYQLLVFAPVFWNGQDPILKERLFGLNSSEGNHGEDVKEYYFHLDATPTHSYAKFLYKYPQRAFPYAQLLDENRKRGPGDKEYELLETGIFDEDRYFDIFIEYAKNGPQEVCIRIQAFNRGPDPAPLHILPHLWFRRTWGWDGHPAPAKPQINAVPQCGGALLADDSNLPPLENLPFEYRLGPRFLYGPRDASLLFTDNETNAMRIFGSGVKSGSDYVKDAFHRHLVDGEPCINPSQTGTKAALHYERMVAPGGSTTIELCFTEKANPPSQAEIQSVLNARRQEADAFYNSIQPANASVEERNVQRQALAGLLWTKQIYLFDVEKWLTGDCGAWPPPDSRNRIRNTQWQHLNSMRILSMPDKWEYPWFAAWDLAFHTVPLALVDPEFAKEQLWLLLFEQFQHPNGQIPAYEWEFSDLNPPVHAWAVWRIYNMDRVQQGKPDRVFLERCFQKLLINFTWWVNKVDSHGNNLFEGGFLGLDNITVLDRSESLPGGASLKQSDATGWMGMFCLNLMRISLELAKENPVYEGLATKFFQHYIHIGAAMKNMGNRGWQLWDEADGFFYDVLEFADGRFEKFRVRSLVGLIPLFAVERLEEEWLEPFPEFTANLQWFLKNRAELASHCVTTLDSPDGKKVHVLAMVEPAQMQKLLQHVWDREEFHSDFGLRSLSKFHLHHPFRFGNAEVRYEPAESTEKLKGGNSNWRGPIWLPVTFMLIETVRKLRKAYGDSFTIPDAQSLNAPVTLDAFARQFADDVIAAFVRDESGHRPIHGDCGQFQDDPHWRELVLFYEYLHGDTGAGLGASHQTGWTALVATLIDEWR